MKLRLGKRIAAICLVAVMLVGGCLAKVPFGAVKVYAATEKTVTLGAAALAANANTENAAGVWYGNNGGYKWRVVGYDGNGVAGESGKMTLLADENIVYDVTYDDDSNEYGGSNLESKVNTIAGSLTGIEVSSISVRTLKGGSANIGESGYDDNKISGNDVPDTVMWPLSVKEANQLSNGLRRLDGGTGRNWSTDYWWLRSPGYYSDYAAYVVGRGSVDASGNYVNDDYGVRPAFYLNLQSIIFSSLISGTPNSSNAEYKLTVRDNHMNMAFGTDGVIWNDKTATVPYVISGINAGNANRISAVITNGEWTSCGWSNGAEVKYYGKVNTEALPAPDANGEVTGTVTFTLPDNYDPSWNIYFLAENAHDFNDDSEQKLTDYASAPVAITRTVSLGTRVLTSDVNTANAARVWYGYNDSNVYVDDSNAYKDKYQWRVVGYNGSEQNNLLSKSGVVTLLASDIMGTTRYDSHNYDNNYGNSDLKTSIEGIASNQILSSEELSAIQKRTLEGGSNIYEEANLSNGYDPDKISDSNAVPDAVMWPLSVAETEDLIPVELRRASGYWWLRSPGDSPSNAAGVYSNGSINVFGTFDNYYGVRPAFYLNLSPVIFSSLISGTAGSSDAEYKLTLKLASDKMQIATNSPATFDQNTLTLTVPYSITGSHTANQVSVLITDREYTDRYAHILQYGRLGISGEVGTSGTGIFKIDNDKVSKNWGTNFHVYILAEEVHLGNKIRTTDYASAPVELLDSAGTGSGLTGTHIHKIRYLAGSEGDAINADCSDIECSSFVSTQLSIVAPAYKTYGGSESADAILDNIADFNSATGLNISKGDIVYCGRNNTNYNSSTVAPVNAGDYTASINVKGETVSVDYSIAQIPITITAASGSWEYDGSAHSDTTVTVTSGNLIDGDTLVAEASGSITDVSIGNNPVASGYKVMCGTEDVTANYDITTVAGKLTVTPLSIDGADVTLSTQQLQFNGSGQSVTVSSVTLNGTPLTSGTDYAVSGDLSGTNKGTYTVTVTGMGNYTGSATATWSIVEKPMTITADDVNVTYDGEAHGITVNVTDPATGYTVKYGTSAGTYNLTESPVITNVSDSPLTVYYQVTADNYDTYTGSAKVTITKATQTVPQLGSTDETVKGAKDGKITGLTTAMEISTTGADTGFVAVTDASGTGYEPGTYYVRYAADDNHEASPVTTVVIKAGAESESDLITPPAPVPGPVIYTPDPTPTPEPEPDPDNYTRTIKNSDGSTTTRTVAKNEDGSTTTTEKTVYPGGKTIDTTTVKQPDGSFTTYSETTDASGKVLSTTSIVSSIDTAGVTTRTTDTYNADGTSFNSILKTSKSHEVLYSYVKEVKFDRKGNTVVTSDTKNEDGTKVSKVYKSRGNHGDGVKVSKFQSDKGKVTIPATITVAGHKVKVTAIAGGAFKNDLTLTKVKIGKNVTVIGRNAFKGCRNLKSITINGSLTEVHDGAFKGIAPDAVISIKANKKDFDRIVALIKASGISSKVTFKRIR